MCLAVDFIVHQNVHLLGRGQGSPSYIILQTIASATWRFTRKAPSSLRDVAIYVLDKVGENSLYLLIVEVD